MYEWDVVSASRAELKGKLQELERNWEIFNIIPTLDFEQKRVLTQSVSLPSEIKYDIVVRKPLDPA